MALRGGVHLLVATPGRLLDLVAQRALRPAQTKLFGVPRGCNGFVYAMVAAPSGLIYLGGDFSACEDVLASNVAAYDPRTRRFFALGSGTANGVSAGAFGGVYALALQGGDLIVGGSFTAAGGTPVSSIARWNGSAWQPLGTLELNGVNGVLPNDGEMDLGAMQQEHSTAGFEHRVRAHALVASDGLFKRLTEIHYAYHPQPYEIRMFTSEQEAMAWVLTVLAK